MNVKNNDWIGYTGGIILAVCLFPQIVIIIRRKSTDDISTIWQLLYFVGLLFNIIYVYKEEVYPLFIASCIEISFCILMIVLKIYYSFIVPNQKKERNVT